MELGWGGFDRAKLDMLILIRIPFSFHEVPYSGKIWRALNLAKWRKTAIN